MGNKQTCRIVKIRDVRIKMYGKCERVLIRVRHVPIFKRNLISLNTLDWCESKYKAYGRVLKVF